MNNFLANLARRGAGLGPWATVPSRGIQPEPYGDMSVHGPAGNRRAVRFDETTPMPGYRFDAESPESAIPREAEYFSERQSIDGKAGTALSSVNAIRSAAPSQGKKAPITAVKGRMTDDPPSSAGIRLLRKSKADHHQLSGAHAEEPAEKTVRHQPAPNLSDMRNKHFNRLQNHASWSTDTPLQTLIQASSGTEPSTAAAPAGMHPGVKEHTRRSIRPTGIQPIEASDRFAGGIPYDLETLSHRMPEIPSNDLKKTAASQLNLPAEPSLETDKKSFAPVRITAKQSPMMTAPETISTLNPGISKTASTISAIDQAVQVRIGKVEVRAVHPPKEIPPRTRPYNRAGGFDEYFSVRNYIYREL